MSDNNPNKPDSSSDLPAFLQIPEIVEDITGEVDMNLPYNQIALKAEQYALDRYPRASASQIKSFGNTVASLETGEATENVWPVSVREKAIAEEFGGRKFTFEEAKNIAIKGVFGPLKPEKHLKHYDPRFRVHLEEADRLALEIMRSREEAKETIEKK